MDQQAGNNGSYARPSSQYYDHDYSPQSHGPLTDNRRSFAARSGGQPEQMQYEDGPPDHHASRSKRNSLLQDNVRDEIRRTREPQAALHVPQTRRTFDEQNGQYGKTSGQNRSSRAQPPRVDTNMDEYRTKQRSTESPLSPNQQARSGRPRRGSVPDRSPLQKLEGRLDNISKEEKRARLEEAEDQARRRKAGNDQGQPRSQGRQNDGSRLASSPQQRQAIEPYQETSKGRRHVSAPLEDPRERRGSRRETDNLNGSQPTYQQSRTANREQDNHAQYFSNEGQSQPRGAPQGPREYRNGNVEEFSNRQTQRPSSYEQPQYDGAASSSNQQNRRNTNIGAQRGDDAGLGRSGSQNYRHRARDAGFAGAATAAGVAVSGAAERRNERREERRQPNDQSENIERSGSKKLQKRDSTKRNSGGNRDPERVPESQQQLGSHRVGAKEDMKAALQHQNPDPLPPDAVRNPRSGGPTYQVPPQTAAGQEARDRLGFDSTGRSRDEGRTQTNGKHQHGLTQGHDRTDQSATADHSPAPALDEWRHAKPARLTLDDLFLDEPQSRGRNDGGRRETTNDDRRGGSSNQGQSSQDSPYEETAQRFSPPLYLRCGPLLRYSGMRRERQNVSNSGGVAVREVWRGSVMIVTADEQSSYERAPVLRIFAQPMDLLPPPPTDFGSQLPSEYVDPLAGQIKPSRTGQVLYVKPVEQLEEGVDLSRDESDHGIFERTRSPNLGSQTVEGHDGRRHSHITMQQRSRVRGRSGETQNKYRDVKGIRLHAERGVTFWRFNLEVELGTSQCRVAYRINQGPAVGFWVPSRQQTMNMMFHSCNGFSMSVDSNLFSGPDPLWRDVLNMHQIKPFHVMLGGGDQIYNDAAMRDAPLFRDWLSTKNPEHKHRTQFSPDMRNELEEFYLNRYSMWFSQGLFGMANSQIPMVNLWDDHDIMDGYGSYPHHFMSTHVFTGVGAVAFKYYMLFQHQSVVAETYREEPSWLLGASPGPYINEYSRSLFMFLGRKVAFLGLDCRTERMRDEILSQQSYDLIFNRLRTEIVKGETKHLIVLLGVPIAYPRLNFLENILTSRLMDPIKAIGRTGMLGGFVNKFDGGVEILDDLDDHWTAKHHKQERNWFIQELQEIAADKSVRITILGGDVHLGAVGQFYTNKKHGVRKDHDHRYMPNVVSSAIVNTPPPPMMADILNRRNKVHHLDGDTDEDMIPMFDRDVDGISRANHHLLPRRNYCTIREYHPGSTPPSTPPPDDEPESSPSREDTRENERDRRYPPGSMNRTKSQGRQSFRPGNLLRRLSRSRSRNREGSGSLGPDQVRPYESTEPVQRSFSVGGQSGRRPHEDDGSYFPQSARSNDRPSSSSGNQQTTSNDGPASQRPVRPTNMFHRRPTDLSERTAARLAAKGGADGNLEGHDDGYIDLEGGLDIALNVEVNQHDPSGITVSYRLLVPALWYEGPEDVNTSRFKSRRMSLMDRFRGKNTGRRESVDDGEEAYSDSELGDSRSPSPDQGLRDDQGRTLPPHAVGGSFPRRQGDRQGNSAATPGSGRMINNSRITSNDGTQVRSPQKNEYGPPPSQVQQGPRTTSGRHNTNGNDNGAPSRDTRRRSVDQNAASPPDRDNEPPPKRKGGFFSFARRGSRDKHDEGYGRERYGEDSESDRNSLDRPGGVDDRTDSLADSETEELEGRPRTARRESKIDKFFGIGDAGNTKPRRDQGGEDGYLSDEQYRPEQKRRASWKIWQK